MSPLSDVIRQFMQREELTGAKLAGEIGISATSVSQILTGKTKPRQVTLSRLMKRLCKNKADERDLIKAYESTRETKISLSPVFNDAENTAAEVERVRRFMEIKAKSISFRKKVATKLLEANFRFQQEYTRGPLTTDFLIEEQGKRIAVECRANVERDLEKSLVSACLIRDELKCDQVFIVIPEQDSDLSEACKKERNICDLELVYLTGELTKSLNLS